MIDPHYIQELSAEFNVINNLNVNFDEPQTFDAQFGTVYSGGGECKVLYASTATWDSKPQLVSKEGYIYIYSDHATNTKGQNIPGMKVGDGRAYLIDLPFMDDHFYNHIENNDIHITPEEREFWNNKVTCYVDGNTNTIIFTKL